MSTLSKACVASGSPCQSHSQRWADGCWRRLGEMKPDSRCTVAQPKSNSLVASFFQAMPSWSLGEARGPRTSVGEHVVTVAACRVVQVLVASML